MQLFPSTPTVAIKAPESGIVFQDLDKFVPSCDVVVVVVVVCCCYTELPGKSAY